MEILPIQNSILDLFIYIFIVIIIFLFLSMTDASAVGSKISQRNYTKNKIQTES